MGLGQGEHAVCSSKSLAFSDNVSLLLILMFFFFFHSGFYSHPGLPSECSTSHTASPPSCFHKDASPATRRLKSLGPPVSWGLGASSLTKHRPGSPLLYMCLGDSYQLVYDFLVGVPVSEGSQGSKLIETAGPPTMLPSFSVSYTFPLIQPQGSAASVIGWMEIICIWLFQLLVGSFKGQSW